MTSLLGIELAPLPPLSVAKTIASVFDAIMTTVERPEGIAPIRLAFRKVLERARVDFNAGERPLHALVLEEATRPFAIDVVGMFAGIALSFCESVTIVHDGDAAAVGTTEMAFEDDAWRTSIVRPSRTRLRSNARWFSVSSIEIRLEKPFRTEDGKRVSRCLRNAWVYAANVNTARFLAIAACVEDGTVVASGEVRVTAEGPPAERRGEGPIVLAGRIFFPDD